MTITEQITNHLDNPYTVNSNPNDQFVKYKVHGFWIDDKITVNKENGDVHWCSGGGRDKQEELDDLIALACFTKAMEGATLLSKQIINCNV